MPELHKVEVEAEFKDSASTGNAIPRIGDEAPNFNAVTTEGSIDFHEWKKDKWTILFSHPADFTPVCSTELSEFARRSEEFTSRNTSLIGLSIDSVHSHLAWRENLREKLDVTINYPLIADLDTKVAQLYGLLHPNESQTATVRAVFVIDPKNIVRALIYYPLNVGRNVDEVVRLLDGLQLTDEKGVAAPVNWTPGDKVIVPPPKTTADVEERKNNPDYEKIDFYLNKKEV
ncbi:MAG: peroxiredoxin [Planctomycetota bacterium]|jgi:peroxiredoxin (alkyl hydroperoxide reductase subunit C)